MYIASNILSSVYCTFSIAFPAVVTKLCKKCQLWAILNSPLSVVFFLFEFIKLIILEIKRVNRLGASIPNMV